MSKHKFVSATKPTDFADQLFDVKQEIKKLELKLKILETKEKHLENYLVRYAKHQTFIFCGADGYQKIVKITDHSRMILDQAKVLKLLKTKTPYKESTWTALKIDYVYE